MERNLLEREVKSISNTTPDFEVKVDSKAYDKWFNDLPLIICGPILRKVHYNSVSVWLAFKEEVSDIKLHVFEATDPKTIGAKTSRLTGTVAKPIKIGRNLFITLITAESSSQKLVSDVIYGYSIFFTHNGIQKQLGYKDVLKGGSRSISYEPYLYPTFCLPSDNLNNLKIVHGSCRKPHGGKTDALRALDTMLELHQNNVKERPQLLCLTGDQIYADDVADALLVMIQNASKKLLGWDESISPDVSIAGPRWRGKNIKQTKFTTTDTKSHLIYFGEFLTMYLFCFSEVLWDKAIPEIETVFPSLTKQKPEIKQIIIEKQYYHYSGEVRAIQSFKKCLPSVRKALANVSTLMIFDDHDITDDWHIDRKWNEEVLTNSLGRRIILNGLLAYSIFQDWGNDYSKYQTGNKQKIVEAFQINRTTIKPNIHNKDFEELLLSKLIWDEKKESCFLKNNITWHHQIDYNVFQLKILNTRTERQYYKKEHPLGNLTKDIGSQVGQTSLNKLLIVISAVPVFGNIPLESEQASMRTGNVDIARAIIARYKGWRGMYPKDQESWSFTNLGLDKLFKFLSPSQKILILSGDVHYAFTSYIKLWRKVDDTYKLTEIVQSTSSALKNSSSETHYPATGKYSLKPKTDKPYKMIKVVGIERRGKSYEEYDNPVFQESKDYDPAISKVQFDSLKITPLFQFTVNYIKSKGWNAMSSLFQNIMKTSQRDRFTNYGNEGNAHDVIVGKDNISLISFTEKSITNTIWSANGNNEKPDDRESHRLLFPYTKHEIEFNNQFSLEELPINEFKKKLGNKITTASI